MMKKGSTFKLLVGLILLGLAVMFVGNAFGFWNTVNLKGWWALILVAAGIVGMITDGLSVWNGALTVTGVWLFLRKQQIVWLSTKQLDILFVALLFVILGVWLIVGAFQKKNLIKAGTFDQHGKKYSNDYTQSPRYFAFLSENRVLNSSQDFKGGGAFAMLGACTIDLTNVVFNGTITFDASACLGSVTLIVPRNVRIFTNGTPILGSYIMKAPSNESIDYPVLNITGTAILGSVEIL